MFNYAQGGNLYDKAGSTFNAPYPPAPAATVPAQGAPVLNLLSTNGTKTTFGKVVPFTCTQIDTYDLKLDMQYVVGASFNLVANELQITTENFSQTYTAENEGNGIEPITCSASGYTGGYAAPSGSDETDAYIIITGPKL